MISRVVIVGLGRIGMGYDFDESEDVVMTHARAFDVHPSFKLVGAVEINAELREKFEQRYGVRAFESTALGLSTNAPDVVVVATPTSTHEQVVQEVLACSSVRLILCEKPLAPSSRDAKAIKDMCEARGVQLFVNYYRRALPGSRRIKQVIDSGELGANIRAVAWYSGGLLHNGTHLVDLLQFWFGNPLGATLFSETGDSAYAGIRERRSPDATFVFDGVRTVFVGRATSGFDLHQIEVVGDGGAARFDGLSPDTVEILLNVKNTKRLPLAYRNFERNFSSLKLDQYQLEVVKELACALKGSKSCLTTPEEAVKNIRAIEMVLDAQSLV